MGGLAPQAAVRLGEGVEGPVRLILGRDLLLLEQGCHRICVKVIAGISPEPASLFFRRVMLSGDSKLKTLMFNSNAVSKWIKDNQELLYGAITVT